MPSELVPSPSSGGTQEKPSPFEGRELPINDGFSFAQRSGALTLYSHTYCRDVVSELLPRLLKRNKEWLVDVVAALRPGRRNQPEKSLKNDELLAILRERLKEQLKSVSDEKVLKILGAALPCTALGEPSKPRSWCEAQLKFRSVAVPENASDDQVRMLLLRKALNGAPPRSDYKELAQIAAEHARKARCAEEIKLMQQERERLQQERERRETLYKAAGDSFPLRFKADRFRCMDEFAKATGEPQVITFSGDSGDRFKQHAEKLGLTLATERDGDGLAISYLARDPCTVRAELAALAERKQAAVIEEREANKGQHDTLIAANRHGGRWNITGEWFLSCPEAEQYVVDDPWCDSRSSMSVCRDPNGDHFAAFNLAFLEGHLKFAEGRLPTEKEPSLKFKWGARARGEGEMSFGHRGSMTFSEFGCTLTGEMDGDYGKFTLNGHKIHATAAEQAGAFEFSQYSWERYERERVDRWR